MPHLSVGVDLRCAHACLRVSQSALSASQAESDSHKRVVKEALEEAENAERGFEKAQAQAVAAKQAAEESKRQQVKLPFLTMAVFVHVCLHVPRPPLRSGAVSLHL